MARARHLNPSTASQALGGDLIPMSNTLRNTARRLRFSHAHVYSDGALSPMEQARRAVVNGYSVLGLTDHTGVGGVEQLLQALRADRDVIEQHWPIQMIVGWN